MNTPNRSKFLATLDGHVDAIPPVWLMRQAGRYLPEYRELRAKAPSFLDFCYNPQLASEATVQPIERFGFDAAILFSDILVVPDALGQNVRFEVGEGPRLTPIKTAEDLSALRETADQSKMSRVYEAVQLVRARLPQDVALIGFCGAPWTVATYMIAGQGTSDQAPTRRFAYEHPDLFQALINRLVTVSIEHLVQQLKAGAQAVQIFDSWAGVLPIAEFERWCLAPVLAIAKGVRAQVPEAKIIAFPRGSGVNLPRFEANADVHALGLDTSIDPQWAAGHVDRKLVLQGNLDPLALLAGGKGLDEAIDRILNAFRGRAHVFNLGHGILPPTPIAHVEHLLRRIRAG